jgi:hypothetical protein
VEQLDNSLDSLKNLEFTPTQLAEIDKQAIDIPAIDLWRKAREQMT